MSRCPTLVLCVVITLLSLAVGCSRETSSPPGERSALTNTGKPADPWAGGSTRSGDELSTREVLAEAKVGLGALVERERTVNAMRDKQIAALDDKLAAIQRLLIAGNLDEAEIRLVDIHWKPVGADQDDELLRQYEDKRAALTAFLQRKRSPAPAR